MFSFLTPCGRISYNGLACYCKQDSVQLYKTNRRLTILNEDQSTRTQETLGPVCLTYLPDKVK